MAISPWVAKTKKQADGKDGDDGTEPSNKVICSQYEKNVKKMEGDLRLVKDHTTPCDVFDSQ